MIQHMDLRPDANRAYLELLRRQTPSQKMRAIHGLRCTAWRLKAAWIRQCEPQLSTAQVEERVRQAFLRGET